MNLLKQTFKKEQGHIGFPTELRGAPGGLWGVRVRRGPDRFFSPPLHHGGLSLACVQSCISDCTGTNACKFIPNVSQTRERGCRAGRDCPGGP